MTDGSRTPDRRQELVDVADDEFDVVDASDHACLLYVRCARR